MMISNALVVVSDTANDSIMLNAGASTGRRGPSDRTPVARQPHTLNGTSPQPASPRTPTALRSTYTTWWTP
jgi:hypothetical protein